MQPSSLRTFVLAAAALAAVCAVPANACDKGACGRSVTAAVARPGAHPNAANRAKAKARRAVPTAPAATAGAVVVIDRETGMVAPATPAEIGALSQGAPGTPTGAITPLAAQPEFRVVRLADGTIMADVPPSLRMNAWARVGADGKVTFTCRDEHSATPAAAAPAAPIAPSGSAATAKWEDR